MASGDEYRINGKVPNVYAMNEIEIFCNSISNNRCHKILIVPGLTGRTEDPFSDGIPRAESNKFAVISDKNIDHFLKLLKTKVVYVGDPKVPEEFLEVYFMVEIGNLKKENLRLNIRFNQSEVLIDLTDQNGKEITVKPCAEFTQFLKKNLITFPQNYERRK